MELIRRDTDYALRLAAKMAKEYAGGKALSARAMAQENRVSYPLTCKLLQKMVHAGIIESTMGPKGGFRLAHEPAEIALADIVEAVQGPICVNKCSDAKFGCPMQCECGLHPKMMDLQRQIHDFLYSLSLGEFLSKENRNDQ